MRKKTALAVFMLLMSGLSLGQTPDEVLLAHRHLEAWRQAKASTWMNDFGQLAFYRAANASLPSPTHGQERVIFFGDSITIAWNLDRFFPGRGYINRGIGGQTTSQMLVRFRQDVLDLKPTVVVILAGTNDIAGNTGPISLMDIETNFTTMAELARLHHIAVVLSSLTPVNNYESSKDMYIERPRDEILELNRWLKKYCERENFVYLDYYSALTDDAGMLRKGLSRGDGLHPNDGCYKIMAPLATNAIAKALGARN